MRKLIFFLILAIGIGLGWLSALHDDLGMQVGMMAVGALFASAVGGALSRIGASGACRLPPLTEDDLNPIPGMGLSSRDMAANYWRDEGHPPFMKPPRVEHGIHMLDLDKNI
jgi:hypothetical protein